MRLNEVQKELRKLGEKTRQSVRNLTIPSPQKTQVPGEERFIINTLPEFKIDKINISSFQSVNFSSIASLDTSSKLLRSTFLHIGITGGAIKSERNGVLYHPLNIQDKFIFPITYLDVSRNLVEENLQMVELKNVMGFEYAIDEVLYEDGNVNTLYDVEDMLDEARLYTENQLMKTIQDDLLIVDGPIYPTPVELMPTFFSSFPKQKDEIKHWGKATHRWSMAKLIKDRISVLENRKAVGVVKRLENSRKLNKIFPDMGRLTDIEVLDLLSERQCSNVIYPEICVIGPFKLTTKVSVTREDSGNVILSENELKDRYAYYVILKLYGFTRSFFRIESFDLNVLNDSIPVVFGNVSYSSLPVWIDEVDRRAKEVVRALFYLSFEELNDILSFLHDTKLEAIEIGKTLSTNVPE
ncbi:hypothetical protein ATY89_00835 [Sulfolobus acidocaldarius]|uniref:Conserved Crenarchaeal protein n=3 Tax=Sulfolobus acidocaldarius TaxID=2285 RepID=Q4J9P9_SULAC|nr:DNA double-strand break repair nuclease NurA [Sulfolobus acidocaldarius]AAY80481.1 conserved Crenarchaeal protein [Sulfolobus acidocaldarius DSM 639]AGE73337.1 hypothetical protein SacRon12I_05485 [Sulfolobus acidocaldarius Ron12/I]ALU30511.1 hypothetical protein ATY89_00835 [Sulfolobus acidocaldarius]ALU32773.1 hypothetical protein ATZ20_03875 [Sulfolobus acidocaldarius]WCM35010.1 hypothetical protein GO597_06535 [Sulfolobus acidocaldarius DSM 639]